MSTRTITMIGLVFMVVVFVIGCASRTELGITHLPDRFTDRDTIGTSFYLPNAQLIEDQYDLIDWDRRVAYKFDHAPGENYVLHIEHEHYDKKGGVIEPDYAYQVNIEIPPEQFVAGNKIPAALLQGYLVWGGENSIYRREFARVKPNARFVASEEGNLFIRKIYEDGTLLANARLYFIDAASGKQVLISGNITAERKTREQLAAENARAKQRIHERARDMENEAWSPKYFKRTTKF